MYPFDLDRWVNAVKGYDEDSSNSDLNTKEKRLRRQERFQRRQQRHRDKQQRRKVALQRLKKDDPLLAEHQQLPYWPWQCLRLDYGDQTSHSVPNVLYHVKIYHHGSGENYHHYCDFEFFKQCAYSPYLQFRLDKEFSILAEHCDSRGKEWETDLKYLMSLLTLHIDSKSNVEDDIWLSAFSQKSNALFLAKKWTSAFPNDACRIAKINTICNDMMIYKATDLYRTFDLQYDPTSSRATGSRRLFKDEYLIAHKIPAYSIQYVKPFIPESERYAYLPPPTTLNSGPTWQEMTLSYVPRYLYRVLHTNNNHYDESEDYGVRYLSDEGFDVQDPQPLHSMDSRTLWKGLRLHLNWNTSEFHWQDGAKFVWISTFDSKEVAAKWLLKNRKALGWGESRLITIDTSKFDCTAWLAIQLIWKMEIPLKPSLEALDFSREYLILNRVPVEAFVKEEGFPDTIDPADVLAGLTEVLYPEWRPYWLQLEKEMCSKATDYALNEGPVSGLEMNAEEPCSDECASTPCHS